MISVILTIHNQAELLPRVLGGLDINSGLVREVIAVIDGCTDNSETIFYNWSYPFSDYVYNIKILHADNIFETKANNLGLHEVTQPYAVIVQDDCVIKERGWDRRLLEPFLKFDDVIAVSGNMAHNVFIDGDTVNYNDFSSRDNLSRDTFSIRDVVNRGPLMLDMERVRMLDYLDEVYSPQTCDDHDLCVKAFIQNRFISGCYWIDFESKPEWGSTRKGDNSWWQRAFDKNRITFLNRYRDYLLGEKHNEERSLT